MAGGLLQPGPTLAMAEELRKRKGSRGLLEAVGEPLSYAPIPGVAAIGQGLLGARYLTGEKPIGEGLASLSDMTAMAVGSMLPPMVRNVIAPAKAWYRGTSGEKADNPSASLRKSPSYTSDPEVASHYAMTDAAGNYGEGAAKQVGQNATVYKATVDESKMFDMRPYMEGAKKYGVESGVTYGDAVRLLKDLGMSEKAAKQELLYMDIAWQRKYGRSGWDNWAGPVDVPKANTPMVANAPDLFERIHSSLGLFGDKPGVLMRGSLRDDSFHPNVPFKEAKVYDELRPIDESAIKGFWGGLLNR